MIEHKDLPSPQRDIIDDLIADLSPVRPIRPLDGMALTVAMTVLASLLVAMTLGVRSDLMAGDVHRMFFVRAGMLLLVGLTAGYAAIASARPKVGMRRSHRWWLGAVAIASLLPIAAIATLVRYGPVPISVFAPAVGAECLTVSGLCALIVGTAMTLWLRRGAPTSPERAGWLVGLASGGLGAAAYSICCPFNSVIYVGTWYSLAVILCAFVGRLAVPRLLRW